MGGVGRARRSAPSHRAAQAELEARANGGTLLRKYRHPYNAGQHNKKSLRAKRPRGLGGGETLRAPQTTALMESRPASVWLAAAAVALSLIVAYVARTVFTK